jgi:hypothetical protein
MTSGQGLLRRVGLVGVVGIFGIFGLFAAATVGVSGCGDKNGGGAEKFVGTWTYAGSINPNCASIAPIDLTGDTVVITATDSSHLTVALANICTITFDVDGSKATAQSGQTCSFDIPSLGPQSVMITNWTLTMSDMDTVASNFMGFVAICMPSGTGTLTRQASPADAAVD